MFVVLDPSGTPDDPVRSLAAARIGGDGFPAPFHRGSPRRRSCSRVGREAWTHDRPAALHRLVVVAAGTALSKVVTRCDSIAVPAGTLPMEKGPLRRSPWQA